MHLRIHLDHQKLFFKKDIFYRLEWLKTCFDAFAHTSRPQEKFYRKRYFWKSGVVKNVFWCICAYFETTRNFFSKKILLNVWSGLKRVLMHLRILPDHQKVLCKKYIFYWLEWLKTCLMHLRILPDHQKLFSKKIFWNVCSV